jgi:hypothetical protein
MKVKELIVLLSGVNPEAEVILQKDAEGNGYSPLSGVDTQAVYVPESTWSGEVYDLGWTAEEAGMEEEAWKLLQEEPSCVVLYPVN